MFRHLRFIVAALATTALMVATTHTSGRLARAPDPCAHFTFLDRYQRGRTRAQIGPPATIVNGTASGKSSSNEQMSACRTIVANARVASNIAK